MTETRLMRSVSLRHDLPDRTYKSGYGRPMPTWKSGIYGRYFDCPGLNVPFDTRVRLQSLIKSRSQPVFQTSTLNNTMDNTLDMESATGMKLQLVQLVHDFSSNQRRSLSARRRMESVEKVELPIGEFTEEVGHAIKTAQESINDMFSTIKAEYEVFWSDLGDLTVQLKDVGSLVDDLQEPVNAIEKTIGHF